MLVRSKPFSYRRVAAGVLVGLLMLTIPCYASVRMALVVGNSNYKNVPFLPNPSNNSGDVTQSFTRLGFSVTRLTDARLEDMQAALRQFGHAARDADIAVVYFAGHGMEVGGVNWLIPIDAALERDVDIDKEAVSLNAVIRAVQDAKFAMIILDACRTNPFAPKMQRIVPVRAVDRGLAPISRSANMLVAYAAREGTTASDGIGRNSPFTSALLANLETPGVEIDLLFRRVTAAVRLQTKERQQPFVFGTLSKQAIYLKPAKPSSTAPAGIESAAACDRLAASPFDRDRPTSVPGVEAGKLDVVAALSACEGAIRQYPQVARFYFQQGRASFQAKNYARARELYQTASSLGSSMAMYGLGVIYSEGLGIPKAEETARFWFKKSVDLGNTHAMAALGLLYSTERPGFTVDYAQARLLFEQAAVDRDPIAMNGLGVLYELGRNVIQDYAAARTWYEKASALGNEVAMRNLGSLFERGVGVPKDIGIARHWYEQAAAAGDQEAKNRLQSLK